MADRPDWPGRLEAAGTTPSTSQIIEPTDDTDDAERIAVQLRRRRLASYRLPPLASGFRDPLDGLVRR